LSATTFKIIAATLHIWPGAFDSFDIFARESKLGKLAGEMRKLKLQEEARKKASEVEVT
jgi:hypothetical protein